MNVDIVGFVLVVLGTIIVPLTAYLWPDDYC